MRSGLLAIVVAVTVVACGHTSGGGSPRPTPNSVSDVTRAFAAHGVPLYQAFKNNKRLLRHLQVAAELGPSSKSSQDVLQTLNLIVVYYDPPHARLATIATRRNSAKRGHDYRVRQFGNVIVTFDPHGRGVRQVRAAMAELETN